jgi:hypothetical protein
LQLLKGFLKRKSHWRKGDGIMKDYTAGDLFLMLNDLYGNKLILIKDTFAFKLFDPSLSEERILLSNVRKAGGETPLVQALEETEQRFDSGIRAFHYVCFGLAQFVDFPKDVREFLDNAKKSLAPSLRVIKNSHKAKAASAKAEEKNLAALKASLEAFPIGPNATLYTLAAAYIEAGGKLDTLLSSRADTFVDEELKYTKEVRVLRSRTVGIINKFREALAQEVKINPALPRDLEARVFAYYDQLGDLRGKKATDADTEENSDVPAPAPSARNA